MVTLLQDHVSQKQVIVYRHGSGGTIFSYERLGGHLLGTHQNVSAGQADRITSRLDGLGAHWSHQPRTEPDPIGAAERIRDFLSTGWSYCAN